MYDENHYRSKKIEDDDDSAVKRFDKLEGEGSKNVNIINKNSRLNDIAIIDITIRIVIINNGLITGAQVVQILLLFVSKPDLK